MKVIIKRFTELTNLELYNIIKLRTDVFVYEQKILVEKELDDDDFTSLHLFIVKEGIPLSYARLIGTEDVVKLGRICTHINYRGRGYSKRIIEEVTNNKKYKKIIISSQHHAVDFYINRGFIKEGSTFIEAGIVHQKLIYENK